MTPFFVALRLGVGSPEEACSLPPTDVGGVLVSVACPPAKVVGDKLAFADVSQASQDAVRYMRRAKRTGVTLCSWGQSSCEEGWSSFYLAPVVTAQVHLLTASRMDTRQRKDWMWGWRHELEHVSDCVNFLHRLRRIRADSCPHVMDAAQKEHLSLADLTVRRDSSAQRAWTRRRDTPPPAE